MAKKFDVKALREKVLSTDDVKYESFYVEEWDAELPVKTLTAPEIKKLLVHKNDEIRMMILAVLYGCKTKDGEAVFEETDLAAFETKKSFGPIAKIGKRIMELSGLSEKAIVDAKKA
ncbi:MAG: hypothetical protein ACQEV7_07800 [Bacillota bacterium]